MDISRQKLFLKGLAIPYKRELKQKPKHFGSNLSQTL
jgi:hypothetical protein